MAVKVNIPPTVERYTDKRSELSVREPKMNNAYPSRVTDIRPKDQREGIEGAQCPDGGSRMAQEWEILIGMADGNRNNHAQNEDDGQIPSSNGLEDKLRLVSKAFQFFDEGSVAAVVRLCCDVVPARY